MWLKLQQLLMNYIVAIPLATELIYWAFSKTASGRYYRGVTVAQCLYDMYVNK